MGIGVKAWKENRREEAGLKPSTYTALHGADEDVGAGLQPGRGFFHGGAHELLASDFFIQSTVWEPESG